MCEKKKNIVNVSLCCTVHCARWACLLVNLLSVNWNFPVYVDWMLGLTNIRLFYISLFIVRHLTLFSVNPDCNLSLKSTSVSYFSSLVIDPLILFPFIQIVHAESEWYWGQFFDNVANSDYKEKAMNQLAIYLGKWDLVSTMDPNWALLCFHPFLSSRRQIWPK